MINKLIMIIIILSLATVLFYNVGVAVDKLDEAEISVDDYKKIETFKQTYGQELDYIIQEKFDDDNMISCKEFREIEEVINKIEKEKLKNKLQSNQ